MGQILNFVMISLLIASSLGAPAEETLTLLSYPSAWRYNQDGIEPRAAWKDPGFDDGTWLLGEGAFAVPETESLVGIAPLGTVLSLYAPTGTAQVITYYFRAQFDFPYVPDGRVVLTASNLIDDGAVFYVNGIEVGRIGMPAGAVTYARLATRNTDIIPAGTDRLVIPHSAIVQGTNTLAVEVHQVATNSNDAVFGLSLYARMLDPIQIVRQPDPEAITLEEGQTLSLSVDVTGSDPAYQWYRGTNRLGNYPTRDLVWPNISTNDAGNYYVVVSNSFNVVTSRTVAVTVVRDVTPPVLLSAAEYVPTMPSTTPRSIVLTFNELLARAVVTNTSSSATNGRNYTVRELGTTNLVLVTNVANSGNLVLLAVSSLNRASMYLVTVTNVCDVRSNRMTAPGFAPVGFSITNVLASPDSVWAWDESGADLGTAWRERDYDDSHWPRGRGIFAFEFDTLNLCNAVRNTALSPGPVTCYFRFPFVVPRTSGRAVITSAQETIDDGAILYLNGQELWRVNMPAGPVTPSTPATAAREGTCASGFSKSVTNLVEGTNVIAVEVHQAATDYDVMFGMQLTALMQLPHALPVPLNIARTPSGKVAVSWTGREGQLKISASPTGPWLPLGTNSPVILPPDLAASFFRMDPFIP